LRPQRAEKIEKMWSRVVDPAFYFLRRLRTARAATPSIKPAIIDSHGKPGTAGRTIGVETDIVVELIEVVGVLTTVIVDTDVDTDVDTEVLTTVVVSELVVVEALEIELTELELVNVERLAVDCCTVF